MAAKRANEPKTTPARLFPPENMIDKEDDSLSREINTNLTGMMESGAQNEH